jgi:class 3 adenylate cyclase
MTPTVEPPTRTPGRLTLRLTLLAAFAGIAVAVSLVIGVATAWIVGDFVRDEFRLRLSDLTATGASQIDAVRHQRLQKPEDEQGADYLAIQDQLRTLRDSGTNIRFVYTLRRQQDGQLAFVVDAEQDPAERSALGDIYADTTPLMHQAFDLPRGSTRSLVERHFYTDAWGTWMSAYAPLYRPDGRVEAVLGMDISADRIVAHERQYQIAIWGACALFTLLFMPLTYWLALRIRRPMAALEADMMQVRQFNLGSRPDIRSTIIEINSMAQQLEHMKSGLRSFQKYVSADLVRRLMARGVDAELGGHQQEMTFFMSDVEGFTGLCEQLEPTELVRHLGEYFTAVSAALMHQGATVDNYIGDAVLAFWNAPEPNPLHAVCACDAALACQVSIDALNQRWAAQGDALRFRTRIGLNTGLAIVGNIGSQERLSYTVIGDQVNLVSRLEAANKLYGTTILVSEHTQAAVQGFFATRLVDRLVVYGKTVPIRVYELLGRHGDVPAGRLAAATTYEAAFQLYQQRHFAAAAELLQANLVGPEPDPPSAVLLARCQRFQQDPPAPEWDGSHLPTSK